jgi:hypothetical protein
VGAGWGCGFENTSEIHVMKYNGAMESNDKAKGKVAVKEDVDISPSSQPDQTLSAIIYWLKPNCNLSQLCHGRMPIACTHITGNSNTNLSKVSYRNLLISKYRQGCNQC